MLKKESRYSFKNGVPKNVINSSLFTLRYQKNNLSKNTFAVVVSKKVDKKAVVRNRVRRKFLDEIKSNETGIKNGYNCVFFLKKNIIGHEKEIGEEIKKTMLQIV